MRYKALAALSLLGGCISGEEIEELTTVRRDQSNSREINFSEVAPQYKDNLFAAIGERLRNYDGDVDVILDKGIRKSFFPRLGGGRIQVMRVRENHVIFEYSDDVVQGIPGYNGIISSEDALFLGASKKLVFSYEVRNGYILMEMIEGHIYTGYISDTVKALAAPILEKKGIDPEMDVKKIIIGEFDGINPAAFVADPEQERFVLLDLGKRTFIEPRKTYNSYSSVVN